MFDPEKLMFSKPNEDPLKENSAVGKVLQVGEEKENIRILIDLGIPVTLITSKQAYKTQQPLVGDRVEVIFPTDSIQVL